MRLDRLLIQGLGPFDDVEVRFDTLPGPLVAVTGANGSGKTTFLELFPGAVHRSCPTRGALASLATRKHARVEADVVAGGRYTIRQDVDAMTGKGSALVLDADGAPVLPSTKVTAYDAWAAKHITPPPVFFSSSFAAQGGVGLFHKLKPGPRKGVLLRIYGIDHLEELAKRARERAKTVRQALAIASARLADETERGVDVDAAELALGDAVAGVAELEDHLAAARRALEEAEATVEGYREARALLETRERIQAELLDVDARLQLDQALADNATEIRTAVEAHQKATEEITRRQDAWTVAARDAIESAAKRNAIESRIDATNNSRHELEVEIEQLDALLDHQATIEGAVTSAKELDQELAELRANLAELHQTRAASGALRIAGLRGGLEQITEAKRGARAIAEGTLAADGVLERKEETAPAEIDECEQRISDAVAAKWAAEELAARAGEVRAAANRRHDLGNQIMVVDGDLTELRDELREAVISVGRAETARREAHDELELARRRSQRHAELAAQGRPLRDALGRLEALEPKRRELQARLEEIGTPADPGPVPDVDGLRGEVRSLEDSLRRAEGEKARAEQSFELASTRAVRLTELRLETEQLEEQLADWIRLGQDLGRDGLQALEIDAAGPELTDLVNLLLHECVSSRWSATIETTKPDKTTGRKQLEGLEIMVTDSVAGRDAPIETYSGGEQGLLGDALALALMITSCNRQGIERPTLVRDESGSALDPENGRAYIAMLRKAAELTDAAHVLFVSHSAELTSLADAWLDVDAARIEVRASATGWDRVTP